MALTDEDRREIGDIAELRIRQYFDQYLERVLPKTGERAVETHNLSVQSHGQIQMRFNRLVWILIGASAVGGGVGTTVARLLATVGG